MFIWCTNRIIGYTIALVIASLAETNAQLWDVHLNAGLASYSHPELHKYQDYFLRELAVEGTVTEKFPPYLTYSLGVNRNSDGWSLGVEIGHGSTGGRIYYEDYSGKLMADQLVTVNYITLVPSFPLYKREGLRLSAGVKVSVIRHKLFIRNDLTLGSDRVVEEIEFVSGNFGVQPNISIRHDLNSRFFFHSCAGYEIQDRRQASAPNSNEAFLADENGEPVHLQGSGFRLSAGIGVKF